MELFKQSIQGKISIDDNAFDEIRSAFTQHKLKKGMNLIEENAFCNQYFFIEKGLLRFVCRIDDKEETPWVLFEGTFFTEFISFGTKARTKMRVQALESSVVYSIGEDRLNDLCEKVSSFERYLRLTWEESLCRLIQMKLLQQFSSAKARYEMLSRNTNLMQRIPQKYLASILGITPYSLSRLRKPGKG